MGRKYASIHIKTDKQTKILSELKKYYDADSSTTSQMHKASKVFINPEVSHMFERFAQLYSNKVIIIQSEWYISIYDETLTFESIEEKAKIFSYRYDYPIAYVSNFDNEVLMFGIFKSGDLTTNRNVGKGLSIYEIPYTKMDISKLSSELKIYEIGSLEAINSSEEIGFIENEISHILHMPLKITNEDVQSEIECYEEKFSKNGLYIYKKL